ncbi:LysR substrate-binding domain-containing protein [Altererythrobacter sp. H2]|uniref:LysR substrate-binding domain-containing protein n=1 Tax=Altererythrobacter sp. H2 TaxID=3108391 RepID=UPI002B4BD848|nr:LysR substrate-binding domain-containing protein [Altererythrobacter sp. H2]WRK94483.1 LysR substrate-binding domain-containing protein [Altererythrobacter sp. H2]
MLRNAPSLESIEIFVSAARGQSFRAVGRGLALSPSAISRRIAALEAFLGAALFDRSGTVPALTAEGKRYLALVEPAMRTIQGATLALREGESGRLTVAASHSFATTWLMPRIAELRHDHGIEVEIVPTRSFDVLRSGEAQIGIWGGLDAPEDMIAEHLFDAPALPVCAPRLADGRPPPATDAELRDYPLLTVKAPAGLWPRFFASVGLSPSRLETREHATLQLMYEAALAGIGVAHALPLIGEAFLHSGRLIPCAGPARSLGESYRLFRPVNRLVRKPAEARFTRWLTNAVGESVARFKVLHADHREFAPADFETRQYRGRQSGLAMTGSC